MSNCSLLNLPLEILFDIFDKLDTKELHVLLRTCKKMIELIAQYNQLLVFEYSIENNDEKILKLLNLQMFPLSVLQDYAQDMLNKGYLDEMLYVLDYNYNISTEVNSLLLIGILVKRNIVLLEYLINYGKISKSDLNYLLIIAASGGNETIVKFLLDRKKLNFTGAMLEAIRYNKFSIVKMLIKKVDLNYSKGKFLREAIFNNNFEILKYLISKGADINADEGNLLFFSIAHSNIEIFNYLINNNIVLSNEVYDRVLYYLITYDMRDEFKKVIDKYKKVPENSIKTMIIKNNLIMLKYVLSKKFPISEKNVNLAKSTGNKDIIKIIEENT